MHLGTTLTHTCIQVHSYYPMTMCGMATLSVMLHMTYGAIT